MQEKRPITIWIDEDSQARLNQEHIECLERGEKFNRTEFINNLIKNAE